MDAATLETHPLISMRDSETVSEAARLMADFGMSAIGVLDDRQRFSGILTERDITWLVAQGKVASEILLKEVVNDFPVIVDAPVSEAEALEQMAKANIRHLIIRDGQDHRIISMRDLVMPHRLVDDRTEARITTSRATPTAKDVMTAPPIACRDEAFFEEIAEILADRDISGMPVVNRAGEVVGVISERDLAHALGGPMVRLALRRHNHAPLSDGIGGVPRAARRAQDIMTVPPLTVASDTHLDEVARIMRTHQVNRLPVVDASERLIGVLTRGDVLGAIAHLDHEAVDLTAPPILVGSAGL